MPRKGDNFRDVPGELKQTSKKLPPKCVSSGDFHIKTISEKFGGNI